jgi:hypothetical protein
MKVLCFLILLFWMQFAYAQRINFKTIGNHMIADVMINDSVAAKAFMDTGCPITIIDSTFAVNSGFKINQEGKRLRYHTFSSTSYCYPLMDDTINVNGLRSSRPVYVGNLKRRKGVSDIDMILGSNYIAQDGSRMLTLNIAEGYIEYGRKEIGKGFKEAIMTVDERGFVSTDAPLRLYTQNDGNGQLGGRFVIDTGNANYFFLCGKNERVSEFLKKKGIEPEEKIMHGKTIQYIRMQSAEILGKEVMMKGAPLVILPRMRFYDYTGAIGFKFLKEVEMILDYDNNLLYVK